MTKAIILEVFITNLRMYNEGNLHGEWVDLSQDLETILAKVEEIAPGDDEYFISDYEGFIRHVGEYDNIIELKNKVDEITEALEGCSVENVECIIDAVEQHTQYYSEQIEIIKNGNFQIYNNCEDMADVAAQIMEESGTLAELPEFSQRYFDFEALGRDLEIEGHFYYTKFATYIQIID